MGGLRLLSSSSTATQAMRNLVNLTTNKELGPAAIEGKPRPVRLRGLVLRRQCRRSEVLGRYAVCGVLVRDRGFTALKEAGGRRAFRCHSGIGLGFTNRLIIRRKRGMRACLLIVEYYLYQTAAASSTSALGLQIRPWSLPSAPYAEAGAAGIGRVVASQLPHEPG